MTLAKIASVSALQLRYIQETVHALVCGDILSYSAADETFTLEDATRDCLVDQESKTFMLGYLEMAQVAYSALPAITKAIQDGGGVSYSDFGPKVLDIINRATSPDFKHKLQSWITLIPDIHRKMTLGPCKVLDLGCGQGISTLVLAKAYPKTTFLGLDLSSTSIDKATQNSILYGSPPNVKFLCKSIEGWVSDLKKEAAENSLFDVIFTFDVIHDLPAPLEALAQIHSLLAGPGHYFMLEPGCGSSLSENLGPRGAFLYSLSLFHCMTQSLAVGGEGLGAAWGPKSAESYCRRAGFSQFRKLDLSGGTDNIYIVQK